MNMKRKTTGDKFLSLFGKVIDEPRKLPKTVRAYSTAKRGIGFTRKAAHVSKTRRLMAKNSRRINRGK